MKIKGIKQMRPNFKRVIKGVQELFSGSSPFNQNVGSWLEKYNQEENRKTRLTVALSVLGIIVFLGTAILLPFKDRLFNLLYPKPFSLAGVCDGKSLIPTEKRGFVYTGGDLNQQIEVLKTSLYYTFDASLAPGKQVYMVSRYAGYYADPLNLNLLMGDSLSNTEFRGLGGQAPAGWTLLSAGGSGSATIDTAEGGTIDSQTSVKITNHKSPSGTQVTQTFKRKVTEGDMVVFGSWVKTQTPEAVKIFLQEDKAPFKEFSKILTPIKADKWNFVVGYGKVPAGVSSFQLVIRLTNQESAAWFDRPAVAVIDGKPNEALTKLVTERCGSAWFIGDEPATDTSTVPHIMEPVSWEIYALLYRHLYQSIKEVDQAAVVLPAGQTWTPASLDAWRTAYKSLFGSEPPLDILNIHYLAADSKRWSSISDLDTYLSGVKTYMATVPDWGGKPIWLSQLGVGSGAPSGGVDYMKSALKFLENNNLNIAKWFWFDVCGYDPNIASLFESKNKICSWPVSLTPLGKSYIAEQVAPTLAPTPTAIATLQPVVVPSLTPVPTATSSGDVLPTPESSQNQASSSAQ